MNQNVPVSTLRSGPSDVGQSPDAVPEYLSRIYSWAYLSARTLSWLDRSWVVSGILWGNARRLMEAAIAEFLPGSTVLQAACVYGDFSAWLAGRLGSGGRLDIVDVAPIQVENARRKLAARPWVRVLRGDLARAGGVNPAHYDGVCCFFLLHEVPDEVRRAIVDHLLSAVRVGGKVVFTDYHRMHRWHPLRPVMALVFRWLEPFATSLQEQDIERLSVLADSFSWEKRTMFGGLYQQVVAIRRP